MAADESIQKKSLRSRAEDRLESNPQQISTDDLPRLVQELQVHQIELEIQNEELIKSKTETDELLTKFTNLYDFAPVGYVTLLVDGGIVQLNLACAKKLNQDRSDLLGRRFHAFLSESHRSSFVTFLEQCFTSGQSNTQDFTLEIDNQLAIKLQIKIALSSTGEECHAALTDITQRTQLEDALRETGERFKKLFRCHSAVMLLIDPETGSIIDANLAAESFYGYSQEKLISLNINQINTLKPELVSQEMQIALTENRSYFVFPHRISNGDIRTVEVHSTPIQVNNKTLLFSIIHDISERLKSEKRRLELETQLGQKHKMEAVGYMAGGMAHNFNNNLAIILGNVELSQLKQPNGSEVIPLLENAKISIRNSRDLISKITAYSGKRRQEIVPIQLSKVIKETIVVFHSTMPSTIKLKHHVSSEFYGNIIKADPSQIQEVLINLFNNAVRAMNEKGELKISLKTAESVKMRFLPNMMHCPAAMQK